MTNHTPGPWKADFRVAPTTVICPAGYGVALVREEKDASIIAAAPELLEALKGLMDIAEMAMPDTYFQSDSRVNAARASIAKAEGGAK